MDLDVSMDWVKGKSQQETIDFPTSHGGFPVNLRSEQSIECSNGSRWFLDGFYINKWLQQTIHCAMEGERERERSHPFGSPFGFQVFQLVGSNSFKIASSLEWTTVD